MELRKIRNDDELESLKKLYMASFPDNERKPFEMIERHEAEGKTRIQALFDDDDAFAGLLITLLGKDQLLIDYLAVEEERRDEGLGSKALDLFEQQNPSMPVIVEIEDPADGDPLKIRRRQFYERNGFHEMPFGVILFDVPMRLMVRNGDITFDEYFSLLVEILGSFARPHIKKG